MAPRLVPQIKASLSRIDLTGASALTRKIINEGRDFALLPNFITEEEHSHIAEECRRVLERMSFTPDHFDSVISHYREVIATRFSDRMPILYRLYREKIAEQFFTIDRPLAVDDPHVLELSPNGHIRPHLDQNCGSVIVGLSLCTERVMSFRRASDHADHFTVSLPPRSLYCQRSQIRNEYEHAILPTDSLPGGHSRISVMFRSKPDT